MAAQTAEQVGQGVGDVVSVGVALDENVGDAVTVNDMLALADGVGDSVQKAAQAGMQSQAAGQLPKLHVWPQAPYTVVSIRAPACECAAPP